MAVPDVPGVSDAARPRRGEAMRLLSSVARWCERASDVVAWRIRMRREGTLVDVAAEGGKARAVVGQLMDDGFVGQADLDALVLSFEGSFPSPATLLAVRMAALDVLLSRFATVGAAVPQGSYVSRDVKLRVIRGHLESVATLMVDVANHGGFSARWVDALLPAPWAALEARVARAVDPVTVVRISLVQSEGGDPEAALHAALGRQAVCRAEARAAREGVVRCRERIRRNRKRNRRRVAPSTQPRSFDEGVPIGGDAEQDSPG